jgi:quinol monooxygenase YgiN
VKKELLAVSILLTFILGGNMSSFANSRVFKGHAVLVIKNDKVEAFKREVAKIIGPTREEPGNISYEAYQILDTEGRPTNRFEFHELWKSKQAMMVDHKENAPHMKTFFKAIESG